MLSGPRSAKCYREPRSQTLVYIKFNVFYHEMLNLGDYDRGKLFSIRLMCKSSGNLSCPTELPFSPITVHSRPILGAPPPHLVPLSTQHRQPLPFYGGPDTAGGCLGRYRQSRRGSAGTDKDENEREWDENGTRMNENGRE